MFDHTPTYIVVYYDALGNTRHTQPMPFDEAYIKAGAMHPNRRAHLVEFDVVPVQ